MEKNKVYVVNKGSHNHTDAERFGELVYLSEGTINRYSTGRIYREFVEILRDSSRDDYILPCGLSIMSAIACSIFARIHGRINLLLYGSGQAIGGRYVERVVLLDELLSNKEGGEIE